MHPLDLNKVLGEHAGELDLLRVSLPERQSFFCSTDLPSPVLRRWQWSDRRPWS